MPIYHTSPLQKKIFQKKWDGCLLNYALFRIDETFLLAELENRWQQLTTAHDILRTTFEYQENFKYPFQNVATAQTAVVTLIDVSELDEDAVIAAHKEACAEISENIKLIAFERDGEIKYLGLGAPITLLDNWSIHYLVYALTTVEFKIEEPLQYSQYLEWLESLSEDTAEIPAELVALWTISDGKKPSSQNLQTGIPIENWRNYQSIDLTIPAKALLQTANNQQTQSYNLLWMVWRFLLNKHYKEQSWQTAWVSGGRQFEEFRQILGPFAKSIPMSIPEEDWIAINNLGSWGEKLELLEAYREYFNPEMELPSISTTAIEYLNHDLFPSTWQQHKITPIASLMCSEPAALKLIITEKDQLCKVAIQYNHTAFTQAAAQAIAAQFEQLVIKITESGSADRLSSFALANDDVKNQMLIIGTGKTTPIPFQSLTDLFASTCLQHANKTALVCQNQTISYQDLYHTAHTIADVLITKHGIKPGDIVAIQLPRSEKLIQAIWAVMLSGATYIPIDTDYPAPRIAQILQNSNATLLLNNNHFDTLINEAKVVKSPCKLPEWQADQIVYIIYTSGTTGNPKGCKISMSNLQHYLKYTESYEEAKNFPLFTSIAFDLTVTSIFRTLTNGTTLYIASEEESVAESLQKIFDGTAGVGAVKLTPSHIRLLPHLSIPECKLSTCIVGGEALLPHDVQILRSLNPHLNIYNEYGPTECTVGCIVWKVPETFDTILIGKPIDNSSVYILDSQGQICPPGIVGELYIGGKTVGAGYFNNPELTAEKFIQSPFDPASTLYKTGDLGYWTADDHINYIGRSDDMVKIKGYRIELEEIAEALRHLAPVQKVYMTTRSSTDGTPEIIAYYVPKDLANDDSNILVNALQQQLPAYMIPAHILSVETFPLTAHGKLDKAALPTPEEVTKRKSKTYVAPTTTQEKLLADIWEKVLHRKEISINDHFLSIGGDSIKAIQVVARLREHDLQVTVRDILVYPTIAELVLQLNKNTVQAESELQNGSIVPLTAIQLKFLKDCKKDTSHYNQSILLGAKKQINEEKLKHCVSKLWQHHDMLRAIYHISSDEIIQEVLAANTQANYFIVIDGTAVAAEDEIKWITDQTTYWQKKFQLNEAPLFRCLLLRFAKHDLVFLIAHHLIIDGVSWRILLDDLTRLYNAENIAQITLSPSASFKQWALQLQKIGESGFSETEEQHWQNLELALDKRLFFSDRYTEQVHQHYNHINKILTASETNALSSIESVQNSIQDILLAALSKAFYLWKKTSQTIMYLESHGRNCVDNPEIFSSTVGWFTNKFPFQLNYVANAPLAQTLSTIQNSLNKLPNYGAGYFLNKYANNNSLLTATAEPQFSFNYLGQLAVPEDHDFFIHQLSEQQQNIGESVYIPSTVLFSLVIVNGTLQVGISYHNFLYEEEEIMQLQQHYIESLREIIKELALENTAASNQTDFDFKGMDQEELKGIINLL